MAFSLIQPSIRCAVPLRSSQAITLGRISNTRPTCRKVNATMARVGGPMLEKRSPGTPTSERG